MTVFAASPTTSPVWTPQYPWLNGTPEPVTISRYMSVFVADCVPEERHDDTWIITDHPVEQGSTISDHVYKLPARVTLTYVWSFYAQNINGSQTFLRDLYAQLLSIQAIVPGQVLTPFSINTGKRLYQNMLVESMQVTTDKNTENMLMISRQLQGDHYGEQRHGDSLEQRSQPVSTRQRSKSGVAESYKCRHWRRCVGE